MSRDEMDWHGKGGQRAKFSERAKNAKRILTIRYASDHLNTKITSWHSLASCPFPQHLVGHDVEKRSVQQTCLATQPEFERSLLLAHKIAICHVQGPRALQHRKETAHFNSLVLPYFSQLT